MFRHPYSFVLPDKYRDQDQLGSRACINGSWSKRRSRCGCSMTTDGTQITSEG